jgi:hypothetical protein
MNLIFTCRNKKDFDNFKVIISRSKFHADSINYEIRSLFFNCTDQQDADKLEVEIQRIADENDISGYFESEDL